MKPPLPVGCQCLCNESMIADHHKSVPPSYVSGNYLTTSGQGLDADDRMVAALGLRKKSTSALRELCG